VQIVFNIRGGLSASRA